MPKGVYERTAWHKKRVGDDQKGRIFSAETKSRMSVAQQARRQRMPAWRRNLSKLLFRLGGNLIRGY